MRTCVKTPEWWEEHKGAMWVLYYEKGYGQTLIARSYEIPRQSVAWRFKKWGWKALRTFEGPRSPKSIELGVTPQFKENAQKANGRKSTRALIWWRSKLPQIKVSLAAGGGASGVARTLGRSRSNVQKWLPRLGLSYTGTWRNNGAEKDGH